MMKKFKNYSLYFFIFSIFLFAIPNFYILPFLKSAFLTTQAVARVVIVLVFVFKILESFIEKKKILYPENKKIIFLIVLFFTLQSLSIFSAINIISFLSRYKDIVISLIFFFSFYFYKNEFKKIINVLLIASFTNIIFQLFLFIYDESFLNLMQHFLYQRYYDLLLADFMRGRIYITTYDEIIVPFLFLPTQIQILNQKFARFFYFLGISFFSFISNFRTRALMAIFSIFSSTYIFKKTINKKIIIYFLLFLTIIYLVDFISLKSIGYSLYDRLIFNEQPLRTSSLTSRYEQIKEAFEMGGNFLGVGLGNYYDNLPAFKKVKSFAFNQRVLSQEVNEGVHNNFAMVMAESGYISLIIFLLIVLEFIKNDFFLIRKGNDYQKAFVLSFWTLFIYGLFNPPVPASYQILFWGIRGLLL